MGLTHYTQMTSPIRRYLDYLNQKQLLAYLLRDQEVCKPDAMGISELEQHGMGLFATLQEYSGLQDKRKKHWLLKALSARLSVATDHKILLPVEILEVFDEDVLYYLSDFGVIFKGRRNLDSMRPGDHIHLELRAVKLLDRELIGEFRKVVIMENR